MKKLLVVLLLVPFLIGCTIELSDDNNSGESSTKTKEEEKITNQGKSSSLKSPLELDKYGLASKYNAKTLKYVTVDVKITKKLDSDYIDEYNKEHSDNKFTTPKGYKAVVLEYEVVLTNFETENFGVEPTLDVEILDGKGNDFVVSKIKQIIEVKELNKDLGVVKNGSGKVVIAFNIPDNYDKIIVKLGTKGKKVAYFKI